MAKGKSSGEKNYRDASSGQFVTKSYANSHPKTTLGEARDGGSTNGAHRSAITGRFVDPAAAARWPGKTIKDS